MLILLAALALIPVIVAIAVGVLWAPLRLLLPLYAALVPFGSGITLPVPLPNPFNTLTTLVGLAVIVGLVLHLVIVRTSAPVLLPEVGAWLLFAAVNGMTYVWSIDRDHTFERFLILVSLLALYILVALMPFDRTDLDRLRDVIIIGGALACGYGFFLLLTGALPEEKAGIARFATAGGVGDASDPNITAATFILPLVLALSRALRSKGILRLLSGAATALIATGIVLTGSRGGVLSAVIGVLVLLAHQRRPGRVALGVVVGVVVVGVVGSAFAPDQFERLTGGTDSSGRTDIWVVAEAACREHCLYGSGLNTFTDVHRRFYLTTPEAAGARIDEPPHNIVLGAAIELGLPGLVTLTLALGLTVKTLLRLPKVDRGTPIAALVGLLVSNLFLGNLYFKYFWLVLVYAAAAAIASRTPAPPGPAPAARPELAASAP